MSSKTMDLYGGKIIFHSGTTNIHNSTKCRPEPNKKDEINSVL